jgi:hypothetical protein
MARSACATDMALFWFFAAAIATEGNRRGIFRAEFHVVQCLGKWQDRQFEIKVNEFDNLITRRLIVDGDERNRSGKYPYGPG